MQWDLAGYDSHPIDGDPERVAGLAAHLVTVSTDIRAQIERLRACDSGEIWESSAGSADAFQEAIDDLPDKLDLVATRYERVAEALEVFHPVLATTKGQAEYWIQEAAEAQAEVERAESGIELMEDFEAQADRDAEAANADRAPGDPEVQPEQWQGENYHATLAEAQANLNMAVSNCQSAVEEFRSAAATCADAIDQAGNDDLKNDSGLFAGIGRALDSLGDFLLDALDIYVQILSVVAAVIGIVVLVLALTIGAPLWLVIAGVVVAAAVFVGTVILYMNDRRDGWDVAWAGIGLATAGLGVGSSSVAMFFTGFAGGLASFDLGLTIGGGSGGDFLEAAGDAVSEIEIDIPDLDDVFGPVVLPGLDDLPPIVVPRPGGGLTGLSTFSGVEAMYDPAAMTTDLDIPQSAVVPPDVDLPAASLEPQPSVDLPHVTTVVSVDAPAGVAR